MNQQWLSILEYARHYNVSDMTIRRRIKTGKLKAVLKEGKYYIPTQETSPIYEDEIEAPSQHRIQQRAVPSENLRSSFPTGNNNQHWNENPQHKSSKSPYMRPGVYRESLQRNSPPPPSCTEKNRASICSRNSSK